MMRRNGMIATLYAIAMFVLLLYGANLLWMAVVHAGNDRLRDGPVPEPDALPPFDAPWPAVTIQLPLFNEAYVAERLIDACAAIDYPRRQLEVQVLDDSTDDTVDIVARRVERWRRNGLDVVHIHRDDRAGYKAGALQNGLRLARGTFVAVFDADFVPPPDILKRLVPHFDANDVGMVQARWGHLNQDESFLTRLQAMGLDAHFVVEQHVRNLTGCFMNFNGTAGMWRRACIEDAGGWHSDTLAEDLDLSYRAQLKGWRFRFLPEVEVPAELPVDMNALRSQQFRWTKGAAEAARKVLGSLWRSSQPAAVKIEGTFHLTAHVVFPFILLAALLHAPLLLLEHLGHGPGGVYFALMGLGLLGFAGFCLSQVLAQRELYPRWPARLRLLPLFMAGTMGMALNNTRAIWQVLRGRRTGFVRTPKHRGGQGSGWWMSRYAQARLPAIVWLEALLAAYCVAGLGVTLALGAWAAVPFQLLFVVGFGLVAGHTLYHARRTRMS